MAAAERNMKHFVRQLWWLATRWYRIGLYSTLALGTAVFKGVFGPGWGYGVITGILCCVLLLVVEVITTLIFSRHK